MQGTADRSASPRSRQEAGAAAQGGCWEAAGGERVTGNRQHGVTEASH